MYYNNDMLISLGRSVSTANNENLTNVKKIWDFMNRTVFNKCHIKQWFDWGEFVYIFLIIYLYTKWH